MASTETKQPEEAKGTEVKPSDSKTKPKGKTLSPDEIFSGFQNLRAEQQILIRKLAEIDIDVGEHSLVLDQMKDMDKARKCFRMIGNVLCERNVGDILPELSRNKEQLLNLSSVLNNQVIKKGEEINEWKQKYNIKIKGQDELPSSITDTMHPDDVPRAVILVGD